jgi:KUP system potassium uptake protein
LIFIIMVTWRTGVQAMRARLIAIAQSQEVFTEELRRNEVPRVPGVSIFLTRTDTAIPAFVSEWVKNVGSLHRTVIALHIHFDESPRVADAERASVLAGPENLWHVTLRYGFVEVPNLNADLKRLKGLPPDVDLDRAIFFASRDVIVPQNHSVLVKWRYALFAFLFRNSIKATDRFSLPADRTLEVARHINL